MKLPTLDDIVVQTLTFFAKNPPPTLDVSTFTLPFVVGSGNAINTGKILFSNQAAIFADESNFKSQVASYASVIDKGLIKDAVIISASGEKDSVWEVELAKQMKLRTTLLTCKPHSSAAQVADRVVSYKSIAEPYSYNTATYFGMILSATSENPQAIQSYITGLALPVGFDAYQSYAFVLPDRYGSIAPMIDIKDNELFGPHLMIRAYPSGHARHAKFVHRWEKELVITFGMKNDHFGHPDHRWDIPLPDSSSFGMVIAMAYYLCGRIQKVKPPYFEQDIEAYCNDYGPKAYGKSEPYEIIVPANS